MKQTFAVTRLFFKSVYFSPANNPLFVVIGIMGLALGLGKSLGKHEALFMLYLAGLTHVSMGTLHGRSLRDSLDTWIDMLPVPRKTLFAGIAVAALAYALLCTTVLGGVLFTFEQLPPLINAHFYQEPISKDESLDMVQLDVVYFLSGMVHKVWRTERHILAPSIFFGHLPARRSAVPAVAALLCFVFIVEDFIRHFAGVFGPARLPLLFRITTAVLWAAFGALGALIIADAVLSYRTIRALTFLRELHAAVPLLTAIIVTVFARAAWLFGFTGHSPEKAAP